MSILKSTIALLALTVNLLAITSGVVNGETNGDKRFMINYGASSLEEFHDLYENSNAAQCAEFNTKWSLNGMIVTQVAEVIKLDSCLEWARLSQEQEPNTELPATIYGQTELSQLGEQDQRAYADLYMALSFNPNYGMTYMPDQVVAYNRFLHFVSEQGRQVSIFPILLTAMGQNVKFWMLQCDALAWSTCHAIDRLLADQEDLFPELKEAHDVLKQGQLDASDIDYVEPEAAQLDVAVTDDGDVVAVDDADAAVDETTVAGTDADDHDAHDAIDAEPIDADKVADGETDEHLDHDDEEEHKQGWASGMLNSLDPRPLADKITSTAPGQKIKAAANTVYNSMPSVPGSMPSMPSITGIMGGRSQPEMKPAPSSSAAPAARLNRPANVRPVPVQPAHVRQAPVQPAHSRPVPAQAANVRPAPVRPAAVRPAQVQPPRAVQPAVAQPAIVQPNQQTARTVAQNAPTPVPRPATVPRPAAVQRPAAVPRPAPVPRPTIQRQSAPVPQSEH